jgi:hypothetical protein
MTCRNVYRRRRKRDLDFYPVKRSGEPLLTARLASGMKAA